MLGQVFDQFRRIGGLILSRSSSVAAPDATAERTIESPFSGDFEWSRIEISTAATVRKRAEELFGPIVDRLNARMNLAGSDKCFRMVAKVAPETLGHNLEVSVDIGLRTEQENKAMRKFFGAESDSRFCVVGGETFYWSGPKGISGFSFDVPATQADGELTFFGWWELYTQASKTRDVRVVLGGLHTMYGHRLAGWKERFPTKENFVKAMLDQPKAPQAVARVQQSGERPRL